MSFSGVGVAIWLQLDQVERRSVLFSVWVQSEPSFPTTHNSRRPSESAATVPDCTVVGDVIGCQGPQPEPGSAEGCFWVQSAPERSIAHIASRPSDSWATAILASGAGVVCFCQPDHGAFGSALVFHSPQRFPLLSTAQSDNWPSENEPAVIALKDDSFIGGNVDCAGWGFPSVGPTTAEGVEGEIVHTVEAKVAVGEEVNWLSRARPSSASRPPNRFR
jgi:hypothetical protein